MSILSTPGADQPYLGDVSSRRHRAAAEIGTFLRQYGRSSRKRNGHDPNDRDYDRKFEQMLK